MNNIRGWNKPTEQRNKKKKKPVKHSKQISRDGLSYYYHFNQKQNS